MLMMNGLETCKLDSMYPKIYGWNKSSESGPDNFAPSVFLGACNFRCAYCMNSKLVLNYNELPEIPIGDIEVFIRDNKCEWINVSGGEVTLHPSDKLIALFEEMKRWGCKIAISTNGFLPHKLVDIFPYLSYVTMDIKTGSDKYYEVVLPSIRKGRSAIEEVLGSLDLLREEKTDKQYIFDYEVRTTLYRPLVGEKEIVEIGTTLKAEERWMLQPFRQAKYMIGEEAYFVEPYTDDEMQNLLELAKRYSDNVFIRYV